MDADYARGNEPYLHPGRQADVIVNDEVIGTFGEVHPDTAAKYDLDARAYVAELRLQPLFAAIEKVRVLYKPLPRFPAVERDLALLCDEELPVADIQKTITKAGGKLLENVTLFDVYQGAQIAAGKKSVAFSLYFRSADGTLSDADIDPVLKKIFTRLEEKGCTLRS